MSDACAADECDGAAGAAARDHDRGSTIPLILGFFLVAFVMVAGSIALGQAFVQQRDLQDVCDGAASAAAASAADLDRSGNVAGGGSLRFSDVATAVDAYLARDPARGGVHVTGGLGDGQRRITLSCAETETLPLGRFFGRGRVRHTAVSSARAVLVR